MARPAIAVALPLSESTSVSAELLAAGFEVIEVEHPRELEKALDVRRDIALAVLDGEVDAAEAEDYETVLRGAGRQIPALTVVSPRAYERLLPLLARSPSPSAQATLAKGARYDNPAFESGFSSSRSAGGHLRSGLVQGSRIKPL